jgi:hypothetical protein
MNMMFLDKNQVHFQKWDCEMSHFNEKHVICGYP